MPSALDYIRRKTSVPGELRTRDWARVDTWIKERAFYMASVSQADILDEFRRQTRAIVSGQVSGSQARETIRRYLAETGYRAAPGLEGTIKDLMTPQRIDVTLRTNVDMARGWAQHAQFTGDITHPGLMLYRSRRGRTQRDWVRRCAVFAGRDDVVLTGDDEEPMIALSCSPVWTMLSAFGQPHPPFDYNSGMDVMPVSYEDCLGWGLITEANESEMLDRVDQDYAESLNSDLSVERDYREIDLRKSLEEQLKGLAEWQGNKLVFTDPNGSRPYAWDKVGEVITADLPEGIDHYQAQALADWVEDHGRFAGSVDYDHGKIVGLDEREDLIRLFRRILPEDHEALGVPLQRTLTLDDDSITKIVKNGYQTYPGKIADSWAIDAAGAKKYLKSPAALPNGMHNVTLICDKYKSARPVHGAIRAVNSRIKSPDPSKPLQTDGEVITLAGSKFKVIRTEKKDAEVILHVEEI